MGMAAIEETFNQTVNILSTEGPMRHVMKIVQEVSEKTTFKDFTILYMLTVQGQGQIAPKILMVFKQFYFLNHTL